MYAVAQVEMPIPKVISLVAVLILTGIIGISSAFALFITVSFFNTLTGWIIMLSVASPLWLFTGYCWYRIFSEKRKAALTGPQKQPEGVWPPAPLNTDENDNEE